MPDDERHIQRALEMSQRILDQINETIREQEGRERLGVISKDLWIGQGYASRTLFFSTLHLFDRRLDLTAPTRNMGDRKLLKEGVLIKAKSGRHLRAFLCNDILVLTNEAAKTLYRMVRSQIFIRTYVLT